MNQVQDDEIDLFELCQTLWDGKWLISAFVAIAVLLGNVFLSLKDAAYESNLVYSVDTIPPFYNNYKALTDFKKRFFSASVFEDWKKSKGNVSLVLDELSKIKVVDGFILEKGPGERLASLRLTTDDTYLISVKTDKLNILTEIFDYANYINGLMRDEYLMRARDELNIIETRFEDFSTANDAIISKILAIDRYIVTAVKGAMVLSFQRPTFPKKLSPNSSLILTLSAALGAMIGVLFVLVRNAITKRKKQLAKA